MTGVDDAKTYTWIADAGSAKAAARSFARGNVRRRRWVFLVLWLLAGALMWASLEDGLAPVERVLWALAYAAVLVACALTIGLLIGRRLTRRQLAARLAPGAELTTRFGPSSLELASPLARHELSYDGLVRVERVDGWVHIRQVGSPVSLIWPGELFPADELEQMRAAIEARTS